jgi:hypothetical protein
MVFGPIDRTVLLPSQYPTFCHPCRWWDTFVPDLVESDHVHGARRHNLLADLLGVKLGLFQRFPAEDRHQLIGRRPVLGRNRGAGLAEPVRPAGDICLDASALMSARRTIAHFVV